MDRAVGNAVAKPVTSPRATSAASDAPLNVCESSPRCRASAAAILGFPPRPQQEPPDEAEHGRSSRREQREREHSPCRAAANTSGRGRSIAIVQPGICAVAKTTR